MTVNWSNIPFSILFWWLLSTKASWQSLVQMILTKTHGMYKGLVCIRFLRIHHLKNLARYVFVFWSPTPRLEDVVPQFLDLCISLSFYPSIWPRKSLDQLTKESQMSVQKDMTVMLMSLLVTQTLCPVTIQIIPQLDASLIATFFNPAMRVEV